MIAHTDQGLNTTYSWSLGAPAFTPSPQVPYIAPILEPGFSPYATFYGVRASVYSAPVLIPTAAVGVNPWDHVFGPIGGAAGYHDGPALALPPQTSAQSMT